MGDGKLLQPEAIDGFWLMPDAALLIESHHDYQRSTFFIAC